MPTYLGAATLPRICGTSIVIRSDADVSVLVVDGVGVAGSHGDPGVRRLRAVGPGPKVVAVRGLGFVVNYPGGGVAKLVQQRLGGSGYNSITWGRQGGTVSYFFARWGRPAHVPKKEPPVYRR